jgi:hypothetical protein
MPRSPWIWNPNTVQKSFQVRDRDWTPEMVRWLEFEKQVSADKSICREIAPELCTHHYLLAK